MKITPTGLSASSGEGGKKPINSELWHACAGPLVSLPNAGSLVVYFPQGHSEQVAASMQKEAESIPSYPNLPSKLICMLHNVTLHADVETDEVYAQMTLHPVSKVSQHDQEAMILSDIGLKHSKQPAEFFCKTLTASDTSTHGGFSVPRRAAEKIFPPLDFSMQPPAQELGARDLHDQTWIFRHIYRGQPKRHLLTTGWSVFVSSKRLVAGDAVLFIRDEKLQLLLGIRRANRQQPPLSSSVLSSDSMHIGILAAAAHAAANNSPFTIFYNPRASPSEFVIPLAKYNKAMYAQVSPGMRFRMMFETDDSGLRRYMGTVTNISDLDPVRWKNSQWRNLQVGWDESSVGNQPSRVSIWDIEPVVTPFYICKPPFFRPNFSQHVGFTENDQDIRNMFKRGMPWQGDEMSFKDASSSIFPGLSLVQWMSMQNQQPSANHSGLLSSDDESKKLLNFQSPAALVEPQRLEHHQNQQVGRQLQSHSSWPLQQQQMLTPNNQQSLMRALQQTKSQFLQQHMQPAQQSNAPSDQIANQSSNQPGVGCPPQPHQILTGKPEGQANRGAFHGGSFMAQDLPLQEPVEQRPSTLLQRSQEQNMQFQQASMQRSQFLQASQSQQSLSEQQVQSQLLQKLQQQPLLSPLNPMMEFSHLPQKQQQHHSQQSQIYSMRQEQLSGTSSFSTTALVKSSFQASQKEALMVPGHAAARSDENAPSCSTWPSQNNLLAPQKTFKNQTAGPSSYAAVHPPKLVEESHGNLDVRIKNELSNYKAPEHSKHKVVPADQWESTSSATSYCLYANGLQQQQQFPVSGTEADLQSHVHNSLSFTSCIDALVPNDSGKDIHDVLPNYTFTPREMDTDLSSGIQSQSFAVSNISFKPGCSHDAPLKETGVLNGGSRPNQTPRMRTYTKVQKRGSVGRTIDVTRYKGYDELRNDLARMFGIEGQLEDPQRTEWKLVYVDHENDILLVGDDPWEEFISCVQSIKILSSAEVQQMSLDGMLGQMPPQNQACSGTDGGNQWRGHYEDNSATSFNG